MVEYCLSISERLSVKMLKNCALEGYQIQWHFTPFEREVIATCISFTNHRGTLLFENEYITTLSVSLPFLFKGAGQNPTSILCV